MTYVWNASVPRGEAAGANATAIAAALEALDAAAARSGGDETFSATADEMTTVSFAGFSSVELTLELENFLGAVRRRATGAFFRAKFA